MILGGLTAAVMAVIFGTWIVTGIVRQLGGELGEAANLAKHVAEGKLSMRIDLRPGDTTSLMAQLRAMQESLAAVVTQVRQGSESVATASAEIAEGNHDLSARTESQASSLEQTAASMDELSATVKQKTPTAPLGATSLRWVLPQWPSRAEKSSPRWCRP